MANNVRHSLPPGYSNNNGGNAKPGAAPLPHINDLISIPHDIPSQQSMKRLIELAGAALQQSEICRNYNRPALALKDFIRANIIAVQTIPSHQDYPSMKHAQGEALRSHKALLKKIDDQNGVFEKIKLDIIADNKRTGVQPTVRLSKSAQPNGNVLQHASSSSATQGPNGISQPPTNGVVTKTKPAVHPKPQALHGNAIKGHSRGYSTSSPKSDLEARFASLRGPSSSQGQDPRIKTHPLVPPRPAGPRDMPTSPRKLKISIDHSVPTLPKMPDAIYSPARGTAPGETPRIPASTPRGLTRTGFSLSTSGSSTLTPQRTSGSDYFSPSNSEPRRQSVSIPPSLEIPEGDTITAEELFEAMKQGSILLIDVRERQEFDEGHIMSSFIVCVEPSVLLRANITGDDISESLVLSPGQEQKLFDRREEFDLVVFYDYDSDDMPKFARSSDELAIEGLSRALTHLSYGHELKAGAKILKGGLSAWIDLMGPGSLKATQESNTNVPNLLTSRTGTMARRGSTYVSKQLKPDDAKAWQGIVNQDVLSFPQMQADFLRRYPGPHMIKESMTSPPTDERPRYGSSHKTDLTSDLPSPPTRPAPAVPRRSYSSLSHQTNDQGSYEDLNAVVAQNTGGRTSGAVDQPSGDVGKFVTGLNNPHNWCYANSTLQSLLAAPDFGHNLAESTWATEYRVPKKNGEKIDHPQLMIKIISNLFHWMSTGKFQTMKAQTLMNYSRHLCKTNQLALQFGGGEQQDAQEFMSFLMAELHDETNSVRDRVGQPAKPDTGSQSLLQAASQYWANHLYFNQSIIDRYWRGLDLSTVQCLECKTYTYTFAPFEWVPVPVSGGAMSLERALQEYNVANVLDDFDCERCKRHTRATQRLSLARMPPLLCLSLRRFDYHPQTGDVMKSTSLITWDFNDIDFSPYFLNSSDCQPSAGVTDKGFKGPFRYECYAVIVHAGSRINNGHYYSYIRDSSTHDPYAWFRCDDTRVTKVRIGSGDANDVQKEVFKTGKDSVPYLLFFKKKDGS